jgi:tRNA-dihydrouridine synthase C
MLTAGVPAVVLAPMEGVTDAPMRALMGEAGGFSYAVTPYIRVSQSVPGRAAVRRQVPELLAGGRTPTGLPVQVQLLGGDPGRLAEAAAVCVAAGATAIDLNFGCPAPTVNRHDGGATLLKHPCRVRAVVAAVRAAVPPAVPVSAKLRLGWDDPDAIFDTAAMAAEGGASWLTVHARTRAQGYAPPVDWPRIGRVRERLGLPVVANGDVWTLAAFRRCRGDTGCTHFMLGRGALADLCLARRVAAELGLPVPAPPPPAGWPARLRRLAALTPGFDGLPPGAAVKRFKQWLRIAAGCGTYGWADAAKRAGSPAELLAVLASDAAACAARLAELTVGGDA